MILSDLALLARVEEIARRVAQEQIMPRFRRVSAQIKADGGLLTEADVATQQALMDWLPQLAPFPVLGEEMTTDAQQALWADNQAGLWVVDPIDGTTNFSRGLPCFSVSIALLRAGRPVLGVIYAPVQEECFSALVGQGAWRNGEILQVGANTPLSEAVAAIDIKRLTADLATGVIRNRPYHAQRNFGASTLDWCWLAAGRMDVMLHCAQKLWDFAAGALILQEAGGRVATLESDDFWEALPWQRSVVAARTAALFTEWREWVLAHRPSAL